MWSGRIAADSELFIAYRLSSVVCAELGWTTTKTVPKKGLSWLLALWLTYCVFCADPTQDQAVELASISSILKVTHLLSFMFVDINLVEMHTAAATLHHTHTQCWIRAFQQTKNWIKMGLFMLNGGIDISLKLKNFLRSLGTSLICWLSWCLIWMALFRSNFFPSILFVFHCAQSTSKSYTKRCLYGESQLKII